jgi:hypothetical protein
VAVVAEQVTMCMVRKHLDAQRVAVRDTTPLSRGRSSCLVHAFGPAGGGMDKECSRDNQEYSLRVVVVVEDKRTHKG